MAMTKGEVLAKEIEQDLFKYFGPKEPVVFRKPGVELTEEQKKQQKKNLKELTEFISARHEYILEEMEHFDEVD
jgi:hypothetical protein